MKKVLISLKNILIIGIPAIILQHLVLTYVKQYDMLVTASIIIWIYILSIIGLIILDNLEG